MTRDAILLMAYGGPRHLDEVEAYYTDIRRGNPPSPALLENLLMRYRAIGGASPLSEVVERQRVALERELASRGRDLPVFTGMRHIEPRIGAVVESMAAARIERFVAIAMAPQQSSNSAGYQRAVMAGLAAIAPRGGCAPGVQLVTSWHDEPRFVDALAASVRDALAGFERPSDVTVLFTAHSLPERVVAEGDVYPEEVAHTAALVAERVGLAHYERAFQSAGRTDEAWLGPELLATLRRLAAEGVREVLVAPVGFVADHLEVLYDIDIEARKLAEQLGIHLERPRSLNDDPAFIAGVADVALRALDRPSGVPSPTQVPVAV